MWIIQWLRDRFDQLSDWFSDEYWSLVGRLRNLPGTLQGWYNQVITAVGDWLIPEINKALENARQYARSLIDGAKDLIRNLRGDVENAVNNLHSLRERLQREVTSKLESLWKRVKTYFDAKLSPVIEAVKDWAKNLVTLALGPFGWILAWKETIEKWGRALDDSTVGKILDFTQNHYEDFLVFITNPLRFTLDLLKPIVLDWLAHLLALALGAENDTIPDIGE